MKCAKNFFRKITSTCLIVLCGLFFSLLFNHALHAQWAPLGGLDASPSNLWFSGGITALCSDTSDNIYISTNSVAGCKVVIWNGSSWSELGGPDASTFANTNIKSLVSDPQGNIYAAAQSYPPAGGIENKVIKWNGISWNTLGSPTGFDSFITCLLYRNGVLYAAGNFQNAPVMGKRFVAVWNGTTWSELGGQNTSTFNSTIRTIIADQSGNIYAGGAFRNAVNKYYVARFSGGSWQEIGGEGTSDFNDEVYAIACDGNGNVYAGGRFTNANGKSYVARFGSAGWSELGGTDSSSYPVPIEVLVTDNQSKLYAGGWIRNAQAKYIVPVWDGLDWSELGGTNSSYFGDYVRMLVFDSQQRLYASGGFRDGFGNPHVAIISTTTSQEKNVTAGDLHLFPNPASNSVRIDRSVHGRKLEFEIQNACGKVVEKSAITGKQAEIDIRQLPSGIYTIRFWGADSGTFRFSKQ